jgi:predicted RNase H-like HicB family nuclease
MVLSAPQLQNLTLHLLVGKTPDGRSRASVLELPDCVAEASTDEQAITQLRQAVTERLHHNQVISIDIPLPQQPAKKAWMKYAGVFRDDPDFAEIAESLRTERCDEGDESVE